MLAERQDWRNAVLWGDIAEMEVVGWMKAAMAVTFGRFLGFKRKYTKQCFFEIFRQWFFSVLVGTAFGVNLSLNSAAKAVPKPEVAPSALSMPRYSVRSTP